MFDIEIELLHQVYPNCLHVVNKTLHHQGPTVISNEAFFDMHFFDFGGKSGVISIVIQHFFISLENVPMILENRLQSISNACHKRFKKGLANWNTPTHLLLSIP